MLARPQDDHRATDLKIFVAAALKFRGTAIGEVC